MKFMIGLALLLQSLPLWASTDLSAAQQLQVLLARVHSFQANFVQSSSSENGFATTSSKGELWAQRPGLFRWQVEPPANQLVVSNGKRIWVYDRDFEQVIEQAYNPALNQTPALLFSGEVEQLTQAFDVQIEIISDTRKQFILQPKTTESLYLELKLGFANDELSEMHLLDSLGGQSHFEFSQQQFNQPFNAEIFEFVAPPGVDVISDQIPDNISDQ